MRIVEIVKEHYQSAPDKLIRTKGDLIVVADDVAEKLVADGVAKWYKARVERREENGVDQHE